MDSEEIDILHSEEDDNLIQYVDGINYVRPPSISFKKIKSNKDFIEYEITTKKNDNKKEGNNTFTNNICICFLSF